MKGKGPSDFVRPSAVALYTFAEDTVYYILDTNLNLIKEFDSEGNIKGAWSHTSLPFSNWHNQLVVTQKHIYWPTQHIEDHVLVKAQIDGKVVGNTIDRIIPLGKQPYTYNKIVFDVSKDEGNITFAYKGLPLIFYHSKNLKIAINLLPNTEIENINTPLEIMPENKRVTVKSLVRSVYLLEENRLLVNYKSKIIVLRTDGSKGRIFSLYSDIKNSSVKFHKMIKIDRTIFVINIFSGEIYRFEIDKIKV